jgi:hypothetical protein
MYRDTVASGVSPHRTHPAREHGCICRLAIIAEMFTLERLNDPYTVINSWLSYIHEGSILLVAKAVIGKGDLHHLRERVPNNYLRPLHQPSFSFFPIKSRLCVLILVVTEIHQKNKQETSSEQPHTTL